MIALTVNGNNAGTRLDRFLALELDQFSRARLQALIRNGFVTVNGKSARPRDLIRTNDLIELNEPPIEQTDTEPESIELDVLFEDAALVVLNKPAGMVVHPGAGNSQHTLVNALLAHCSKLSGIGGKERPGIVHRLDKETSGCLVVAKDDVTHRDLSEQFATRTVKKIYLALVAGLPRKPHGIIDAQIARHPVDRKRMSIARRQGRSAKTEYRVLKPNQTMSLVECTLHTGRTHQIRVHLHHLGHPVLGDKLYGSKHAAHYPRQLLHAWKLGFRHPGTREMMIFEAPLPADFAEAMGA